MKQTNDEHETSFNPIAVQFAKGFEQGRLSMKADVEKIIDEHIKLVGSFPETCDILRCYFSAKELKQRIASLKSNKEWMISEYHRNDAEEKK